jgi:hypothetical protein
LGGWLAHQLGGFLSSDKNSQANRKKDFHSNHPAQELADRISFLLRGLKLKIPFKAENQI